MTSAGVSAREHWRSVMAVAMAAVALHLGWCAAARASAASDTAASEAWASAAAVSSLGPASTSTPAASPSADATSTAAVRSDPTNLVATPPEAGSAPPSTVEIPPASADDETLPPPPKSVAETAPASEGGGDVTRYRQEQSGMPPQQLKDLQEFVSEGELSSPIGIELREARRTLKTGEEADGLLVMDVKKGSAAASAGLQGYTRTTHNVITGAAMAAAMVFPPAILIIPALDYTQIGESYDLIIGVDGSRVTNFLDFQDKMRDVEPGELIYFSVVRNGRRLQISVPVPSKFTQLTY